MCRLRPILNNQFLDSTAKAAATFWKTALYGTGTRHRFNPRTFRLVALTSHTRPK